jgi:hypothetical protein
MVRLGKRQFHGGPCIANEGRGQACTHPAALELIRNPIALMDSGKPLKYLRQQVSGGPSTQIVSRL